MQKKGDSAALGGTTESRVDRAQHGLGTIFDRELGKDVGNVVLNGLDAEKGKVSVEAVIQNEGKDRGATGELPRLGGRRPRSLASPASIRAPDMIRVRRTGRTDGDIARAQRFFRETKPSHLDALALWDALKWPFWP